MPAEDLDEELRAPYFWCYISHRGREKLPQYRYAGSDRSLVYQYVFSPNLNKMLERGWVPRWLHPNVITVGGFMLVLASHLLMAFYSPDFVQPLPAWVLVVSAIALHVYQWLDALDGKQARHLGLGSPLGLLCDHGCDSVNASITALNACTALGLGSTNWCYVMWAATASGFFFNTWEEWFVGSLDLPIINGPNEGLLTIVIAFLWTAVVGQAWWHEKAPFMDFKRYEVILTVYVSMGVLTVLGNIYKTLSAVHEIRVFKDGVRTSGSVVPGSPGKPGTAAQRQAATKMIALTRTIPFVAIIAAGAVWIQWSPSRVFDRHPRLVLLSLGLFCSKCCSGLMVAHLCDDPYRPFCKTLAAVTALAGHHAMQYLLGRPSCSEDILVYELFALSAFSIGHMALSVTWEISRCLNINVCTVPKAIREAKPKRA
eukprot:TRINITY_DN10591_c0_g1_i1.p1 TRINITY_DN10591_c0_g1~~TRINITY_DN10591_c0_g1_i1.p1  ORF type:complete len:460 (+),score=122.85 TRINITY_DN10591_c0_g1_i1:99-1382(+)